MQLWNDYEGATLAGQWPLGRLLRTEGRSALFVTETRAGEPAVLRVTEALNDQPALRARFRSIQSAGDRFLVRVESAGEAELDGTPVFWVALEPTQESLADILSTRKLDMDETLEVAQVVTGGLLALHREGLVHGRVEPESVLAAGDHIKLRSDCARPAPNQDQAEEDEDAVTPRTDAWGLANVIHLSLTRKRLEDPADALALPEPYAAIVRNTAKGQWGVPEIDAELTRHARGAAAARMAVPIAATPSTGESRAAASSEPAPVLVEGSLPDPPLEAFSSRAQLEPTGNETASSSGRRRLGLALGAAALVIALILFFALRHSASKTAAEASAPMGATAAASAPAVSDPVPEPAPHTAPAPQPAGPQEAATPANARDIWRVVAFTYNRRQEAERKASEINRKHPNYKADVWSRNGQRPFLVTLGGLMPHDQALEMRTLARDSGVAPDVYAQNYAH